MKFKNSILCLGPPVLVNCALLNFFEEKYAYWYTYRSNQKPSFSSEFPAQRLQTQLEWEDLVLPEETWIQLRELEVWLKHKDFLMEEWQMARILKPGYKALFFGPPGTGKTLTAALLGKKMDLWVRYARTSYFDKTVIGSGNEAIQGNKLTEVKLAAA